jgi:hypothetical protein
VGTWTDLIIDIQVPEGTPIVQTIPTVMVRTTVPQPGMEPLLDEQQGYQEEQQVRARPGPQCPDDRAAPTQGCARNGASHHNRLYQSLSSIQSHRHHHQPQRYATPHLLQGNPEHSHDCHTFGHSTRALYNWVRLVYQ